MTLCLNALKTSLQGTHFERRYPQPGFALGIIR